MKTKELLNKICEMRVRFFQTQAGNWNVIASSDGQADDVCRKLLDSGEVKEGVEYWEKLPGLGLVQHVFTLNLGHSAVRIVSPAIRPNGQFSNGDS